MLVAALLACGLAGCAAEPEAPPGPRAGWPASPPAKVDGDYKGRSVLAENSPPGCPGDSTGLIEIGDQQLVFAYRPDTIFIAPIQADGTLHATQGSAVLDGTLAERRLVFTVRTPICESAYTLDGVL